MIKLTSSVGNMKANKLHEITCTDLLACHLQQAGTWVTSYDRLMEVIGMLHVHVQFMKTKKSFMD